MVRRLSRAGLALDNLLGNVASIALFTRKNVLLIVRRAVVIDAHVVA